MTVHTAFPDLLGRLDRQTAPWTVSGGRMAPGMAWTALGDRRMSVPDGDTETERTVRAHEMLHAKVTPAPDQMRQWHARGRAHPDSLTAGEELRVNTLAKRLGFDVDVLTDGSETQGGEWVAQHNRWEDAVRNTCAFANTGRFKAFLVGVRRHNPEWAKTLRAFHDRLVKEVAKVSTHELASTATDAGSGLAPLGYRFTEAVAVLVDHMCAPPDREPEPPKVAEDRDEGEGTVPEPPPVGADEVKHLTLDASTHWWDELRPGAVARPRHARGGIGKKKVASATGRTPRHMTRMLTDPHRRVFERKVTGRGGVVLIDGSASMRMSEAQVMAIVEAAPGCTVLMYCSNAGARTNGLPNLWVLADKGTVVDTIPERHKGNGVDLPALQHALASRQRHDSPVVWVTDGLVHGPGQRYTDGAAVDCVKAVLAGGVLVRPTLDSAVLLLSQMAKGAKPTRWWPPHWDSTWRKAFGRPLPR